MVGVFLAHHQGDRLFQLKVEVEGAKVGVESHHAWRGVGEGVAIARASFPVVASVVADVPGVAPQPIAFELARAFGVPVGGQAHAWKPAQ
ncbi:MAG: hypothetical protein ACK55I_28315, partial [bacterium]